MNAAQGAQSGAGDATEMQQAASQAMATRQGAYGRHRHRFARASRTWAASITRTSPRAPASSASLTGATASATSPSSSRTSIPAPGGRRSPPTLHVGRWNDIWEIRVNPFQLSKALAHVALVVDTDRLNDEGGRALIALGILEAVEACTRASEMVERLDGTYIHDDDWDEERSVLES